MNTYLIANVFLLLISSTVHSCDDDAEFRKYLVRLRKKISKSVRINNTVDRKAII